MARIPMGNFGNAMPQVDRIQMPQRADLSASLSNLSQLTNQVVQENDNAQREQEASAKRLELYGNQLADQEAKIKLDDVLTSQMSEQVTLVKNDVANGRYDAKAGDEALRTWGAAKYKELENELPLHSRQQLQQYWQSNVNREASSLLPLQLRADSQKGMVIADRAFDIATRKNRNEGREYLSQNFSTLNISESEKQNMLQKYETTRDILDIDDKITVAVNNKDTQSLEHLIKEIEGDTYKNIDGPTAQSKKSQALSRINAINTQLQVEENKRVNEAGKIFNEFKTQILTGRMLDGEYLNNVGSAVVGTEYESEFSFYKDQSVKFQEFSRLPTSEQLKLINQQKVSMKNSTTSDATAENKILSVYENIYKDKIELAKNNPNQIVREIGLEVNDLNALEMKASPSDFIKKVIDNGSSQLALNDANIKLSPISAEELPEIKNAFDEKSVDQKLAFIGGLIQQSKGLKNGNQVWSSVLEQLGDGNQNYVVAGLAKQNNFKSTLGRDLSTSIVNGTQLLKNKQLIMPKEDELRVKFNEYLGNTATGSDANTLYETFKAVYADTINERAIQHKAKDESPDKDAVEFALSFSTGGVYTQSGKFQNYAGGSVKNWKVSKPYGRTDDWFESQINAGYEKLSKSTGMPVSELEGFRLQRSTKKTERGEIQYELLNERGNPLIVDGAQWRIVMQGVTK